MNPRLRRLQADFEKNKEEFVGHKYIKVEPVSGNPPEKYVVTYKIKGLKWDDNRNRPVEIHLHKIEINLHSEYPREKPKCVPLTEIFHPNFGTWVCIGDNWAPGETLADIIIKMGNMIQYLDYNPKSALNRDAAEWAVANSNLLPVGKIDLYQPEPDIEMEENTTDDIEIILADNKQEEKNDDLEIELK